MKDFVNVLKIVDLYDSLCLMSLLSVDHDSYVDKNYIFSEKFTQIKISIFHLIEIIKYSSSI